uniref:Uncharacterized protein n=1 Tax=Lotharella vacuolata TaxID=74820 RepID=A0A0H5BKE7_9EUKA|nr:hypothetical protein [Lotharella vacuolata]
MHKNVKKINTIIGSKIQFINTYKKPIIQLKISWKNDIYENKNIKTWEDSINISSEIIDKYELWIWKKITHKKNIKYIASGNFFFLFFFLHDNIQRNFSHYAPLLYNIPITNKIISSDIILEITDRENRTAVDIAVNYLLIKLIKLYLSKKIVYKQTKAIFQKIIILLKIRIFNLNQMVDLNSTDTYYNLVKILKLIFLWIFHITKEYDVYFYYKKITHKYSYLTLFNGCFKWITNNLFSENTSFTSKVFLIIKKTDIIISKRMYNKNHDYLCTKIYNSKISNWIKNGINNNDKVNHYTLKKSHSLINSLMLVSKY